MVESMSFVTSDKDLSTPYARDNYQWDTTGGRISYQGFLGSAYLGSLSAYRVHQSFGHGYTMPFVLHGQSEPIAGIPPLASHDGNSFTETALEATLDASSARRYHVTSSLAFIHSESRLEMGNGFFREVEFNKAQWRITGHVQNNISLGRNTRMELGLRYTFVQGHREPYAEPRIGLRHDGTCE